MKRLFTSAFVILLSIGAAQAQTTSPAAPKGHGKEHSRVYDQLNLTPDQKARLQALKEEHKKQAADLKANTQLSETDVKAKRKELRQQHKAQVEAILTPEQKTKLQKLKAERKTTARAGKGNWQKGEARGLKRSAELQKELGLSAEQQQKVEQIRAGFRTQMQSVRNNTALTPEQKKTAMQELMKQQQEQMKTVLTQEQQEKLQSLRKERAARNTR